MSFFRFGTLNSDDGFHEVKHKCTELFHVTLQTVLCAALKLRPRNPGHEKNINDTSNVKAGKECVRLTAKKLRAPCSSSLILDATTLSGQFWFGLSFGLGLVFLICCDSTHQARATFVRPLGALKLSRLSLYRHCNIMAQWA